MDVIIDLDLLKQELALNNISIAIDLEYYHNDIILDLQSIETIINNIYLLIQSGKLEVDSRKKIARIQTVEDYLVIVARNYIIDLRDNCTEVISNDTEFYLSIVYLTAYLSKMSNSYFNFYQTLLENIPSMDDYFKETQCFIDADDIRGLLFAANKKYLGLDLYDKKFIYKNKNYLYSPPKVDKDWIHKYRKENQPICFWFYENQHGFGLFIVLYSLKCRYAKCIGCSLHELSSEVKLDTQQELYKQIDYIADDSISCGEKKIVSEVIISNNGNMLDSATMPILSLLYIIDKCIASFPGLNKIILESRLEYIDETKLDILQETIQSNGRKIDLEIAVGLEIFDDFYRNNFYRKGIKLETFEEKIKLFSKYNMSVRVYMMYKACPHMTDEEAINDINQASIYLAKIAQNNDINITLHISPTFVAKGSQLETLYELGQYKPPDLYDIEKLLESLEIYDELSYYMSFNDEGLAINNLQEDYYEFVRIKDKIERFNLKI